MGDIEEGIIGEIDEERGRKEAEREGVRRKGKDGKIAGSGRKKKIRRKVETICHHFLGPAVREDIAALLGDGKVTEGDGKVMGR